MRLTDIDMRTVSANKLAPFLVAGHADAAESCRVLASLFANAGGSTKLFPMYAKVLEPLLALAKTEPAALPPLATAGRMAWAISAYPETRACLSVVCAVTSEVPHAVWAAGVPWDRTREPMTVSRERAAAAVPGREPPRRGRRARGRGALRRSDRNARAARVPESQPDDVRLR